MPHDHQAQGDYGGADAKLPMQAKYFCSMCEGVEADQPGDCPPATQAASAQAADLLRDGLVF